MGKSLIQLKYPDQEAIRRKLIPILENKQVRLPTPEYLIPTLKQKAQPSSIKTPIFKFSFVKTAFKSLIGHSDWVRVIAFSANGKYLVSGSNDRTVRLWDVQTGQIIHLFKGHKERVKCVWIDDRTKQIISGSADSTLKLWNLENGDLLNTIETSLNPKTVLNAIAIIPEQQLIVTGSTSVQGTIKRWHWQTGEMLDAVNAAFSGINSLALSADNKILASGSGGRTIKIWHLDRGLQKPQVIPNAHESDILSLAICDRILISGGKDRTLKLWILETGEKWRLLHMLKGHVGSIWDLAISPDGKTLASASGDFTVKVWEIETGKLLETLTGHLVEVRTVAFSPDGKILASAGDDWEIKLWNM
ncbi:MAG: WD40 repeat domain-containing protein [Cyanobacteria bacterium P01_G01_bin.39]